MHHIPHHIADVLADSRGAGKAGALNTGAVDEGLIFLYRTEDEFVVVLMGPEAGKGRDDLPHGKVRYAAGGLLCQLVNAFLGRVHAFFIIYIRSGRAYNDVAVDGRRNEDALAVLRGLLEDGPLDDAAGVPVQEIVLALPGGDVDFLL